MLYEEVVEVKERLVLVQDDCGVSYSHHGIVVGKSDVKVRRAFAHKSFFHVTTVELT